MSKVKCARIVNGRIPSEKIVRVKTYDGPEEEVLVSSRQIQKQFLLVSAIHSEGQKVLVELPQEGYEGIFAGQSAQTKKPAKARK